MSSDRQSTDILRLLAANVPPPSFRSISAPKKSTTTWNRSLMAETMLATTSSKLMKSSEESNSQPESSPLSLPSQKSSLFALNSMDKEQSTNLDNIPDALPPPHPDGFPELLPIKSPKSSNNPDSSLLLIPRVTTRLLLKHLMSISLPLLSATLTLLLSSSISLFLATIESLRPSPPFSGYWPEKWWFWEELLSKTKNGKNSSICSLLVT